MGIHNETLGTPPRLAIPVKAMPITARRPHRPPLVASRPGEHPLVRTIGIHNEDFVVDCVLWWKAMRVPSGDHIGL